MEQLLQNKDEIVTMALRQLFELRGFTKVHVNRFEEYDLYIENRNFLDSDSIITFMDMDGKLKSMKPDVTLSVVKNVLQKKNAVTDKLYYVDEVCRISKDSHEYKMLGQVGVEIICPPDDFTNIEVVDLAMESLAVIGGNYMLDISHLGFVSGLLASLGLSHTAKKEIMAALHAKSLHKIEDILNAHNVSEEKRCAITKLAKISGSIADVLPESEKLICCETMREAYNELNHLAGVLDECKMAGCVKLDFSVVNDLDYYNGLIFHGYVEGVPDAVLTGGRYDNLMKKMGKSRGAIGFAVSLSELNMYFKSRRNYDFDVLITYTEGCKYSGLIEKAKGFSAQGKSVRLEKSGADSNWKCSEYYKFVGEKLISC